MGHWWCGGTGGQRPQCPAVKMPAAPSPRSCHPPGLPRGTAVTGWPFGSPGPAICLPSTSQPAAPVFPASGGTGRLGVVAHCHQGWMRGSQPAGRGTGIGTGTWRATRTVLPAALSGPARGDRIIGPGSNPSCTLSFPRLQRGKESGRNTLLLGSDNRNSRARSGPAAGARSPFQRPPGHAPFSPGCLGPLYSPPFGGARALGAGLAAP